jgi:hypothetical protein
MSSMIPLSPAETRQAIQALQDLKTWTTAIQSKPLGLGTYHAALSVVHKALLETRKYLKKRQDGGERAPKDEAHLSELWAIASDAIRPYDAALADLCMVKGHGWADDRVWGSFKDLPLELDEILVRLMNTSVPGGHAPKWVPVAGAVFAFLTFVSLLYLLVSPEGIPPGRTLIFNVWVAFCVAASGAFLGGDASSRGKIPWFKGVTPARFAVTGGVAVFIITLLILSKLPHEDGRQPTDPRKALVTIPTAGTLDAVELIGKLGHLTGGVILEPKLLNRLKGRKVVFAYPLTDIPLDSVLDQVFDQLQIPVSYEMKHRTVVIRERTAP